MARKVKVPLRLLDVPFLLEFGGGFPVICTRKKKEAWLESRSYEQFDGQRGDKRRDEKGCGAAARVPHTAFQQIPAQKRVSKKKA